MLQSIMPTATQMLAGATPRVPRGWNKVGQLACSLPLCLATIATVLMDKGCALNLIVLLQVLAVWSSLGVDLHGSDPTVRFSLLVASLVHVLEVKYTLRS